MNLKKIWRYWMVNNNKKKYIVIVSTSSDFPLLITFIAIRFNDNLNLKVVITFKIIQNPQR